MGNHKGSPYKGLEFVFFVRRALYGYPFFDLKSIKPQSTQRPQRKNKSNGLGTLVQTNYMLTKYYYYNF